MGKLTIGRVLRSSAEAVQVAAHDDKFSFYGKATQDVHYEPSRLDFISRLHHSTKRTVQELLWAGGFMGNHTAKVSPPASSTVQEGHLCQKVGHPRSCGPERPHVGAF